MANKIRSKSLPKYKTLIRINNNRLVSVLSICKRLPLFARFADTLSHRSRYTQKILYLDQKNFRYDLNFWHGFQIM